MASNDHPGLAELQILRKTLPSNIGDDRALREQLLREARRLMLSLERTDHVVERICFQMWETAVIRVGIDTGMFKYLNDGDHPKTTAELAEHIKTDPVLLGRILRCLASFDAIKEVDANVYAPNNVSRIFGESVNEFAVESCFNLLAPGCVATPDFLRENEYRNPTSGTKTPLAKAYNYPNGATPWEIFAATPHLNAINTYMGNFNAGHRQWFDFYPVEERLASGASTDPSDVMLVDVGGGRGHQAMRLKSSFPNLPGRFIVQDLAQAIPQDKPEGIEFFEHNFFNEQPIKGARLYYLRYVPHDWSQDIATEIVSRLSEAMTPGYSRLIVNEWVVPARGASKFMTAQDMNMMSISGGMERTLDLHKEYLERAGLTVTGVYDPEDGISEGVIEAQSL